MLNPKALSAFLSKEPNRLPREDVALFVDRSEAIERFRHTLATGEPYVAMRTVGRGQDVPEVEAYDWRIERVTLSDGRFGVVCYFYDLTERQPLEVTLREVQARLRLPADAILALIVYVDAERRYQFVNAAYRDWFGVSPEKVLGKSVREVVGEAVFRERLSQIEAALSGEAVRFEYTMPHPRWASVTRRRATCPT